MKRKKEKKASLATKRQSSLQHHRCPGKRIENIISNVFRANWNVFMSTERNIGGNWPQLSSVPSVVRGSAFQTPSKQSIISVEGLPSTSLQEST